MEIEKIIGISIDKLFTHDHQLIKNKMEWATAHRLAVYLEDQFPGFMVDCEYNKMGPDFNPKHDSGNTLKRPDIIVHKRGKVELENNLLIIELKMQNGEDEDEQKLLDFTDIPSGDREFQYQIGLKISFLPNLELKWFREGFMFQIITKKNYFEFFLLSTKELEQVEKLKKEFDHEMLQIYKRALKEANYRASRFFKMLQNYRGVETAKILINSSNVSDGYTALYERGRLDLTVEAVVYENQKWHPLFEESELQICKQRLEEYNYL